MNLLEKAIIRGKPKEVKRLLSENDPNTADADGNTPLHLAVLYKHPNVLKVLLNDERIIINKANRNGDTPLHYAVQFKCLEEFKILLEDKRIDLNEADPHGYKLLHQAVRGECLDVLKILLKDKRIDLNEADPHGDTPLHYAVRFGCLDVFKILLKDKRIDLNKADAGGYTPLDIARKNGHAEMVELLESSPKSNIGKLIIATKSYLNYLENKNQIPAKAAKNKSKIEVITLCLECLVDTNLSDEKKISSFMENFKKMPKDIEDKKYQQKIRILLGIASLGIYAIVRGRRIGSAHFWQTKREVLAEKVDKANTSIQKTPKKN